MATILSAVAGAFLFDAGTQGTPDPAHGSSHALVVGGYREASQLVSARPTYCPFGPYLTTASKL
jgi:hypothetical protein